MTTTVRRGPLVVGLGSPDGGDDAVGPVIARAVAAMHPEVAVAVHEDPTALLDLWEGHDAVVVVDAVRSGAEPGSLHWLEVAGAGRPFDGAARLRRGRGSTHAIGLVEMIGLADALDRLPTRLVVVGVEAGQLDHGAPLSAVVAAAVPTAAERIGALLDGSGKERGDVPR